MATINMDENATGSCVITFRNLGWSVWLPVAFSGILIGVLFWPIFLTWYGQWTMKDSYYSHAFLVPFISGFIVYLKRSVLARTRINPCVLGYFVLIVVLAVLLLMLWAGSNLAAGMAFPLVVAGFVLALFGVNALRQLLFPISYLYFMCVLPNFLLVKLSFKIQMMSTQTATGILSLMGYNVWREGSTIWTSNAPVQVGDPCSGFRLLISLVAFSVLFAYLVKGPLWGRLFLVFFTAPLSLIVNSVRIALIALVGIYYNSDVMHKFHDYSGYTVLAMAFVILWLVARLVKCREFGSMLTS